MKTINLFINEKLKLNSDSKSNKCDIKDIDHIDKNDEKLILAIIKSVFISVYLNRTYGIRGLATYTIKRSEINWDSVADILENEYHYHIDQKDANNKKGELQTLVRSLLSGIEKLINMKKQILKIGDNTIHISGSDIYWKDWIAYREKCKLQGY